MKDTIVLGRGYLGREFERMGYDVLDRTSFSWPCQLDTLEDYDTIINCIGNADTRACEDPCNWNQVSSVNTSLVGELSAFCSKWGKKFVHISTGCVYDKNNTPQKEDGFLSSHCRYVVSKLAAEFLCHSDDLIIRPRLFFSATSHPNNLLSKLPSFTHHLTEINSYTSTKTIVEATEALLHADQKGVFNVAQQGYASIEQICEHLTIPHQPPISGSELQASQGVALVNNILDITKLRRFYQPREIFQEIGNAWFNLHP